MVVNEMTEVPTRRLRIGLLLNSYRCAAWAAKVIADLRLSDWAEIVLVVTPHRKPEEKKSIRERLLSYWRVGLYSRYSKWDYHHHKAESDALASVDLDDLLCGVPRVDVSVIETRFTDRFKPEDIQRIRRADVDVLFRFGFRILKGEILGCAKYGVWSFHHGDNREYRGAPPGFWEIYEKNPVTGSTLQILTESLDGGKVIDRSFKSTNFRSLYANRNPLYWKTAVIAVRRLQDLHLRGWAFIESLDSYKEADNYRKAIYKTPRNWVICRLLARMGWRTLRWRALSTICTHDVQWFLAIRPREQGRAADEAMLSYRIVTPPTDAFHADPCLFHWNGADYVFYEHFYYATGKAAIACAQIDSAGRLGDSEVVLDRPYHLSYPFVFEHAGSIYMMPESRMNRTLEVYRAEEFPRRWVLEKEIMREVHAVDSTLLRHDNKYWLFVNLARKTYSACDELHLFFADSPFGLWQAHPLNPIVSDVRCARSAGAIFREGGKMIRPAQDCSTAYGYAIAFREVQVLSETEYSERPYCRIGPEWAPRNLGTHTYTRTERFEMIDGNFFRWKLRSPNSIYEAIQRRVFRRKRS